MSYTPEQFNLYVNTDVNYNVVSDLYGTIVKEYIKLPRNVHILVTKDNHFWKYEKKTNKWYQVKRNGSGYQQVKYSRGHKNYLRFGYAKTCLDPGF